MPNVRNIKVRVSTPDGKNPYQLGSFKYRLMAWALERGEFDKVEFLAAVLELKAEHKITSRMADDVLNRAWWNEFYNKHHVFVPNED